MKILHVYTGGGEIYGAERMILNLAKEQIKAGTETSIAYFKRPNRNSFLEILYENNIPVYEVNSKSKLDIKALILLLRICRQTMPQILHSHGYKGDIFVAILKKLLRRQLIVSTKHGSTDSSSRIKIYNYAGDYSLKYFDKVIAVSNATREKLIGQNVPIDKIDVIHNGIDLSISNRPYENSLKKELNLKDDCKLVGYIGRLGPEKGIRYLIEAAHTICRNNNGVYFIIVGDGQLMIDVKNFVASNKLEDRVFILGWKSDSELLLRNMDILLLPSLTEGTPMIVLEAMALGVPVIASKVGGVPEMIEDQKTGVLIEPENSGDIVESILMLLKNPKLTNAIRLNSIELVKNKFSSISMAQMYEDVYKNLLPGARPN